ncbi:patatin-like phospholipase family protein [Mycoplasmatota bacterium WC30]
MYALVLAGGGAKGAYQVGVWKALRELNIEIGLVVGTSVGALNGALLAQNSYDEATKLWLNLNMNSVLDADQEFIDGINNIFSNGLFKSNLAMYKKIYSHIKENRGFNITPLRNRIEELLDEDIIRNSGIDFGFVTFSINNLKPLKLFINDIPADEIKYYLLGSALVPGFAQDKNYPTKFIDGGIYDRFPISMAIDKGYKKIIAVETKQKKLKKYKGVNITFIQPSEDLGSFLYFNKDNSVRNLDMGYLDALKIYGKIFGVDYFFESIPSEINIIKKLTKLSANQIKEISGDILSEGLYSLKHFFEKVIPKTLAKLKVAKSNTYQETLILLLEHLLKFNEIERVKQYTVEEALQLVDKEYSIHSVESSSLKILKYILK